MNRAALEKNLVVFLFILVLVIFSFAERDSKKLDEMYATSQPVEKDATLVLAKATRITNRN